jgi:CubicO group peptidase (beta-lactamase class C family)
MKPLSRDTINQFLHLLKQNNVECHAITIVQSDSVLLDEAYKPFQKDALHPLYSVTKSFTGTAVGMLINAGKLSLSDLWLSYFPEYRKYATAGFEKVTIRNLLTMTLGQDAEPIIRNDEDWIKSIVEKPLVYRPGAKFFYNSMCSHLLSCLVQRVTGQKLSLYLKKNLFWPLGICDSYWEEDRQGHTLGGFGLHLKTTDLAKFGTCVLNEGVYAGRQIIPAEWIQEATAKQVENASEYPVSRSENRQGYGYQFWRCTHDAFRCSGLHGQLCLIQPKNKLVIAMSSATTGSQAILNCLFEAMDNPVRNNEQPCFTIPVLSGHAHSGFWTDHQLYRFHAALPNPAGISGMRIGKKNAHEMKITFNKDGRKYSLMAAEGTWKAGKNRIEDFSEFHSGDSINSKTPVKYREPVYGNYAWISKTTLQVQLRALNHSSGWNFLFQLDGQHITLFYQINALYTFFPSFEAVFER